MIGAAITALRSVFAAITVTADSAASAATILHNSLKVGEAQSEQWLLETLEESDIKDFLTREPLRVRLEREEREMKAAKRAAKALASPKA